MSDSLQDVLDYHEATKHQFHAYANGPGHLDWSNQPDPFRRYVGASLVSLKQISPGDGPLYDDAFVPGRIPSAPFGLDSISQLFFDSLALSAWKSIETSTWALRVNPSSGNLHPTEGYLICGPVEGLCDGPTVFHYAPMEHGLEVRAEFDEELWEELRDEIPRDSIFIGLTSIQWREAWKYGHRAYRYCQHDVGHAIGAVSIAAAGLGWNARLLDDLGSEELASLMGTFQGHDAEKEDPDCLILISPHDETVKANGLPGDPITAFRSLEWLGNPNHLSPSHVDWGMDAIADAARKPPTQILYEPFEQPPRPWSLPTRPISLRQMIRQRRSAVAMDGATGMERETFYGILLKTVHVPGNVPFTALPWKPHIHLAIFVHRVAGIPAGLYFLLRDPTQKANFEAALTQAEPWQKPDGCPDELALYLLIEADARSAAKQISCTQDIASDGCFSLGMVAEYLTPLDRYGSWFYPRFFWEAGLIGQVLYLEAEAAGIRSTGIGCYFDDSMHEVLGLQDRQYQDFYHFTIGGAVDDPRLTTLEAYGQSPIISQ